MFFLILLVGSAARAEEAPLLVQKGTVHAGDLVVLGKRVSLEGELDGSAVLVGGARASISGRIRRDLILLGSDATIGPGARIDGDVLSVGGSLTFENMSGARSQVGGRVRSVSALEAAALAELETSPLASPLFVAATAPLLLSFRLFLLVLWMVVSAALLVATPRAVLRAADGVHGRVPFLAALGATAVLTTVFLAAFTLSLLPARLALALGAALLVGLAAAKLFGLTVVFVALGRALTRRPERGSALFGAPAALSSGLLVLGVLSLVPVLGPLVWALASLLGIGVALDAVTTRAPRLVLAAS